MSTSFERIVIWTTIEEKQAIIKKAARLGLSISELMCKAALSYTSDDSDLEMLTIAAQQAVERMEAAMNEGLNFIECSNARIAWMEAARVKNLVVH